MHKEPVTKYFELHANTTVLHGHWALIANTCYWIFNLQNDLNSLQPEKSPRRETFLSFPADDLLR